MKCLKAVLSAREKKNTWEQVWPDFEVDFDSKRYYTSDEFGIKAVLQAAENGRLDCLQLLLEAGLPMSDKPIVSAVENGHTECFDLLWKEHKKRNSIGVAIGRAIGQGSEKCLEMMIAEGLDVNQEFKECRSRTPLMMPTSNVAILQLLIEAGANVNQKNRYGDTPLMWHTLRDSLQCISALIEAGADVNATNKRRQTALMFSVTRNDNEFSLMAVQVLLSKGAKINILDTSGRNALTPKIARLVPRAVDNAVHCW